jgi:hypothetical protein
MRIRNGLLAKYFPEMDRHWGSCIAENLAIVRWYQKRFFSNTA